MSNHEHQEGTRRQNQAPRFRDSGHSHSGTDFVAPVGQRGHQVAGRREPIAVEITAGPIRRNAGFVGSGYEHRDQVTRIEFNTATYHKSVLPCPEGSAPAAVAVGIGSPTSSSTPNQTLKSPDVFGPQLKPQSDARHPGHHWPVADAPRNLGRRHRNSNFRFRGSYLAEFWNTLL